MHHIAKQTKFLGGTLIEVQFQDGKVFQYDMKSFFDEFPQYEALKDRKLFLSGKCYPYSIIWNDDLDLSLEIVHEEGILIREEETSINDELGNEISKLRSSLNISQSELAKRTGINQSDLSRIESGKANPSLTTLQRIATGLGKRLSISFE